jgi:hypothetical protein
MGSGCYHMDGFQKAYQDWLGGCNVVKATSSGTYTLFPLEKSCNGMQVLQVPLAAPRTITAMDSKMMPITVAVTSYYVELRAPIGIDQRLTPRILIEVAGEVRDAIQRGSRNWLLDMTPATSTLNDAALAVGATYKDPDPMGPTITVVSADATKATVKVQLGGQPASDKPGAGTCSDGTGFMPPGPDTCEVPIVRAASDAGAATPADAARVADATAAERPVDATPRSPDGAAATPDAAAPPVVADASTALAVPDADEPVDTASSHGGCGCRLGGARAPRAAWLLLACALLLRRRRR